MHIGDMQPESAASAILIRTGRILLVRRRNPPARDMYAFPGGRAEPGETPEQNALREFYEETGIQAHSPRHFAFYDLRSEGADQNFHLNVFLVEADEDADAVAADDAADAGWYSPGEIRNLPVPESVMECVLRIERELLR
jgi:ADP-ribose pyrophosphatase YjhB (NUDIX family)